MKNGIICFIYSIVVLILLILLYQTNREVVVQDNNTIAINKEQYWKELNNAGKKIMDMKIRNITNGTLHLKEVVKDNKLVVYNPKVSCQPCFSSLVSAASEIFKEQENSVIILFRFHTLRHMKIYAQKNNNTKIQIFDILPSSPDNFLDEFDRAVAFSCESDLIIRNLFLYKPQNEKLLVEYLTRMRNSTNKKRFRSFSHVKP